MAIYRRKTLSIMNIKKVPPFPSKRASERRKFIRNEKRGEKFDACMTQKDN